jgi:hypothetical protein
MRDIINAVCSEIRDFLIRKNDSYGNSAAEPVRIFSSVDAIEQINVRIDDKLRRIAKGHEYHMDDTELDLIGYLILKRCLKRKKDDAEVADTGVFPEEDEREIVLKRLNAIVPDMMSETLAG